MEYKFILTRKAKRDLKKFSPRFIIRIRRKIAYFLSISDSMVFAQPLINLPPATHRFRFGKIRIKFFCEDNIFYITGIDFRGKIYKKP